MSRTNNSGARKKRAIRVSNRLLMIHEGRIVRDVTRLLRDLADLLFERYSHGSIQEIEDLVSTFETRLAYVLQIRLRAVAILFGERVIDRPKSLGLAIETKSATEIFNEAIMNWISVHALDRARTISGSVREKVRGVIQQGQTEGMGERAVARLIRDKVGGDISISSAARIARTEAHTAAEFGANQAATALPIDMVKEWGATEDSRTRPDHNNADGQTREMDEPFIVGGASLMYPGDPGGPPRQIINCRCVALYQPRIDGEIIR